LTNEGNYSKLWKGKNNGGQIKIQICQPIVADMIAAGVRVQRNARQVESKIGHLEQQFRWAYNFANNETGAGLMSKQDGSFEEVVKKHCKYYFNLEEIMGNHSSTGPKATCDHNLANELDSDDDSNVDKNHLMMNHRKKDTEDDNYNDEYDTSSSKADNGDKLYETLTVTTK
jgi:hypothetical protein